MLWEQFRSHARALLGQHFPPELLEDNGDSIVFTSRRDYTSYVLTEDERGIVIAFEGERNTVVPFCITKSHELATTCLTLLARDGIATLTDMSYTPRDLLGPVPRTAFTISKKSPPFFELTSTIDPAVSAKCRSFRCARAIAEASTPSLGSPRP
ncbi:hypothetical protein QP500_09715 [Pauljensenia sp. UMB0018B]|uniref:Uncharacterized protein n=1 Tax=Schaalia odontolytica TaxID=1660 RepID=A0A2I1HXP4_9ACTO|nr:hypothetical protein [Schaalia odontolytica]MDK7340722.1 hypothetical protein [Pauljensenia sp. UMB0018B]PKY63651.1 hypothetical protein CYJ22_09925 [Schaalia odontolytica]